MTFRFFPVAVPCIIVPVKKSKTFWAPLDGGALGTTLFVTALCMILPFGIYKSFPDPSALIKVACVSPLLLLFIFGLFAVKSYHVEDDTLCIKRGLGTTYIPLRPLESAEFLPSAMHGSWKLCGSGGMFGWIGWYRNATLGNYRAWVTDRRKTVVLKAGGKTYVISPLEPDQFVQALPPIQK